MRMKVKLTALMLSLALIATGAILTVAAQPSQTGKDDIKLKVFIHYRNPNPVIDCSSTANDTVNDYGLAGWHLPAGGITYMINFNSAPSNLLTKPGVKWS